MAQSINTHWPSLHCFLSSVPCSFLSGSLDKNHGVASLDIGICAKWRENLEEVVKHRRTAALRSRNQSGLSQTVAAPSSRRHGATAACSGHGPGSRRCDCRAWNQSTYLLHSLVYGIFFLPPNCLLAIYSIIHRIGNMFFNFANCNSQSIGSDEKCYLEKN
jgi:hypothetical protein